MLHRKIQKKKKYIFIQCVVCVIVNIYNIHLSYIFQESRTPKIIDTACGL